MPRAQNSYSYLNAAFLLKFADQNEQVESAKICYGGVSEYFIHAEKTEKFLIGKNIFTNETFTEACEKLAAEIDPENSLTQASVEYRKHLAISLFYKFVLNIAPEKSVDSKFQSGKYLLKREVSTASQEFEYIESRSKLYKKIPKAEADIQCTGETQYINDLPPFHNELFAAFVLGDKVHGIIKNIDASEALKVEGVFAFYGAKDVPGLNNFMPLSFSEFNVEVEEVFCSSKLLYHGQPVGIILANSFDLAYKARDMVKVEYSFEKEGKLTKFKVLKK
jgi:xanthine dehydrogenase/oxidase